MAINYRKLRGLSAREIISALIRDGFVFDRQSGAHQHYRHPETVHMPLNMVASWRHPNREYKEPYITQVTFYDAGGIAMKIKQTNQSLS